MRECKSRARERDALRLKVALAIIFYMHFHFLGYIFSIWNRLARVMRAEIERHLRILHNNNA